MKNIDIDYHRPVYNGCYKKIQQETSLKVREAVAFGPLDHLLVVWEEFKWVIDGAL